MSVNEFLEYFVFPDFRSLVHSEILAQKKSSAIKFILILENISLTPAHNISTPEVITNSCKETMEIEKERGGHGFLLLGSTFPLFHIGPRAILDKLFCGESV